MKDFLWNLNNHYIRIRMWEEKCLSCWGFANGHFLKDLLALSILGGGADFPPSSFFSITEKVIKIICSIFLTLNKIEFGIFCRKIKVIGLILAFLRLFFYLSLKIPKWKSAILGRRSNFRSTVHFNFFDPYTKIHTFTNFYASMSKNDFKIAKTNF